MPQQPSATSAGKNVLCISCMDDGRAAVLAVRDAGPPAAPVCALFANCVPALLAADEAGCDSLRVALFFRCFVFGIAPIAFLYD